jgi:hypothetical protein
VGNTGNLGNTGNPTFPPLFIPLFIPVFTLKPITYRVYDTALHTALIPLWGKWGQKKRAVSWRARLSVLQVSSTKKR